MKLACIVTMYSEHSLVLKSLENIRSVFPSAVLIVIHSDNHIGSEELDKIKVIANEYILLPDMSIGYTKEAFRLRVGSRAWGRNFSKGFSTFYSKYSADYIVAFSGDTFISDATNILRRVDEMDSNGFSCYISKAIGSRFHAATDMPEQGIQENRPQDLNSTDFLPTFFILNGTFAKSTNAFADIEITNELTFEQCMGDALMEAGQNYPLNIGILSHHAYGYIDGIKEQFSG